MTRRSRSVSDEEGDAVLGATPYLGGAFRRAEGERRWTLKVLDGSVDRNPNGCR